MDTEMKTAGIEGLAESEQRWFERRAGEVRSIQEAGRRRNVEEAAKIGEILMECQERLASHNPEKGTFVRWIEGEFGMSTSTAYRAIEVCKLVQSFPTVGKLLEVGAAYAITEKACPEPAKKEVLKLADKGKVVTQAIAKEIIKRHKPDPRPKNDFPDGYSPSGIPSKGKGKKSGSKAEPVGNHVADSREMVTQDHIVDANEMVPPEQLFGDSEQLGEATVNQSLTVQGPVTVDPEVKAEASVEEIASAVMNLSRLVFSLGRESPVRGPIMRRLADITEMLATGEPVEEEQAPTATSVAKIKKTTVETPKEKRPRAQADQVEAIYNAYPRKVAPQLAKKAIAKALELPETTFEGLLEATEEYARSRVGKDKSFTPHPATWFNRGSWDDDRSEWWRDDKPRDGWDEFEERGSSMSWLGQMIRGEEVEI